MSLAMIEAACAHPLTEIPARHRMAAKLILMLLAHHHHGQTGRCDPGAMLLAREAGVDRKTVFRALEQLAAAGLVMRAGRAGTSNSYTLHLTQPVPTTGTTPPRGRPCDRDDPTTGTQPVPTTGTGVVPTTGTQTGRNRKEQGGRARVRARAQPPPDPSLTEEIDMRDLAEALTIAGAQFVEADEILWCRLAADYGRQQLIEATAAVNTGGEIARARAVQRWLHEHGLTDQERVAAETRAALLAQREQERQAELAESRRRTAYHQQRIEEAQAEAERLIERVRVLGIDPPPDDGPTSIRRILERHRQTGRVAPALLPRLREWVDAVEVGA